MDDADSEIVSPHGTNESLWAAAVAAIKAAEFPDAATASKSVLLSFLDRCRDDNRLLPAQIILDHFADIASNLWRAERLDDLPVLPDEFPSLLEEGRWRDRVMRMEMRAAEYEHVIEVFIESVVTAFMRITRRLPALAQFRDVSPTVFAVSLSDLLPGFSHFTEELLEGLQHPEAQRLWLFTRLDENPFDALASVDIPFQVPDRIRGQHTAVIAPTGSGKTQLALTLIGEDLQRENPPGMVIVDPTGNMVGQLQRLAVFNEHLKDRLIILDPEHDPAPSLNLLDIKYERLLRLPRRQRQAIENHVVKLFAYVLSSAAVPLTGLQSGPFSYLVRLLLTIPGARLTTFRELLDDLPKDGNYDLARFKPYVERLDPEEHESLIHFFRTQYYKRYANRRDQISDRIQGISDNAVLNEMLNAPVNKIDWFAELNRGAIILVNTSKKTLAEESILFGRLIIANVFAAVLQRREHERRQAFLIVDEAANYFDDQMFEELLTQVRQFGLGITLMFQDLKQPSEALLAAISGSTAVKYVSTLTPEESRFMARVMGRPEEPQFIAAQQVGPGEYPSHSRFAVYARGLTREAISLRVPFGELDKMPKMSDDEHRELLARNEERVVARRQRRQYEPAPLPDEQPEVAHKAIPLAEEEPSSDKTEFANWGSH